MKRNYVDEPMYEMYFEFDNGDSYYLYGKFQPKYKGKIRPVGDSIPVYSIEECEATGRNFDDVVWIDMPYGDYECEYEGGLFKITKNNEPILVFFRSQLVKCWTKLPIDKVDGII